MAIYYIDPHTTTNGDGSWASPWSISSSTRTGLASGDEVRIKGVALTSLLTATEYTGCTWTTNVLYRITIPSGIADFAQYDVIYFPEYGFFSRIYNVNTGSNYIDCYSNGAFPLPHWGTSSFTIRKVDTATYGVGATSTSYYFLSSIAGNPTINVSDGWTSESTRVTDGSVVSLLTSSTTSAANWYPTSTSSSATYRLEGSNIDLRNTHAIQTRSSSSGRVTSYIYANNSTCNVGSVLSWYMYSGGNYIYGSNNTINYGLLQTQLYTYGSDNTITVNNWVGYQNQYMGVSQGGYNNYYDFPFYMYQNINNGLIQHSNGSNRDEYTVKYDKIYVHSSGTPQYFIYGDGLYTLEFSNTFAAYRTYNSPVDATTTQYFFGDGTVQYWPTYINLPTTSFTTAKYNISNYPATYKLNGSLPAVERYAYRDNGTLNSEPQVYGQYGGNLVITYDDRSGDPFEYLGVFNTTYTSTGNTIYPKVTRDFLTFKTSSPSLKINLNTWNSSVWTSANNTVSKKIITIPVASANAITVAGYVRTDDTAYTEGYCKAQLYAANGQVAVTQNITTSAINAWEGFSLNYTPDYTGEAYFSLTTSFQNGGKSFWLDDFSVS